MGDSTYPASAFSIKRNCSLFSGFHFCTVTLLLLDGSLKKLLKTASEARTNEKIKRKRSLIWHKTPKAPKSKGKQDLQCYFPDPTSSWAPQLTTPKTYQRGQFQREGGGGAEVSLRRRKFVGEGSGGIHPQNTFKFRGSEMVFSTFSMSYFSKKTKHW